MSKALGLVETRGLVAAIEAADAMLKAANVKFVGKSVTVPALITIKVVGDTAAVKAAVDAGAAAASRVGQLISTHIIPQPDDQLLTMLPEIGDNFEEKTATAKAQINETQKSPKTTNDLPVENDALLKNEAKIPRENKPEKVIKKIKTTEPEISDSISEIETDKKEETHSDTITRLRKEALENEMQLKENDKLESTETEKDFEKLNVHELRRLARSISSFPIKGREISRANRDELLEHFRSQS